MSATVLRRPARAGAVARHYLALLGRETAPGAIGLAVAVSLWSSVNREDLFEGMVSLLPLMAFLPLFQWRGGGRDHAAAHPLGGVRHDLVRVACGTAWAAATLAVPVALHAALHARGGLGAWLGGYPWWYPLPLLAAGLAFYLFGSAVWLRTPRPGRVLLVLFFFAKGLWEALGLGEPGWAVVYGSPDELRGVGAPEGIAAALAWLGAGCAAVGLSAAVGGRAPRAERGRDPSRIVRWPARRGAARRGPRPVPARPPRPASALTALRAQAALVRHRVAWPAAIALLIAWAGARAEIRPPAGAAQVPLFLHDGEAFVGLAFFAFFWPLLVWMDERGPGREHAEALPVGVLTLRLARVAAGGAALGALCAVVMAGSAVGAWIAGTLHSPAAVPARVWAGIPAGVLMMYLAGSLPLLLSPDRPLRRMLAWYVTTFLLVIPFVMLSGVRNARFSPTAALSVFWDRAVPWTAAALLWLVVLAAAAAYAAALGASNDRGGPWSPADAGRAA